jgi:hypothetical protein
MFPDAPLPANISTAAWTDMRAYQEFLAGKKKGSENDRDIGENYFYTVAPPFPHL